MTARQYFPTSECRGGAARFQRDADLFTLLLCARTCAYRKPNSDSPRVANRLVLVLMIDVLILLRSVLASLFKSRARLETEILVLRQQIIVLRRKAPKRPCLTNLDRLAFLWLYRLCPAAIDALTIIRPETVLRWHRCGFRAYWRWLSRCGGGRPRISKDLRKW